ncbi:MAG: bifunctional phosphoglucose/phosphomannose isomerase [Candidatus Micrarchaeota archaeon]|nr:bifunctional phosphoglucose/phosphomannose isomerase [Candidatus Micrarchaeota archaeon]MDE1834179.1 bifunctional phosphoglucose/phosphomannose isomerase [Candidatus Micrarchaeota archaeon]MDE1859699.1 bifunctional phosphoglucose/phosphomannose isomerase [Candidatus Micrarchaeota archaeon]
MQFLEELRFLKEQLKVNEAIDLPRKFDNIVVAGMGGSGISGKIFQELYSEKPVFLVEDYEIPNFVSKNTLFIGISYSGSTQEVLTATKSAVKKEASTVTISAGGELADHGDQHINIPRKDLQPRSATGYMLTPFLRGFKICSESEIKEAYKLLSDLDGDHKECSKHAKAIADAQAIPVIYGVRPFKSVAYRWKTQFNENSKIIAYSGSFPELNHNDTMAIAKTYRKKGFYYFTFSPQDKRILRRIQVTEKITNSKFAIIDPKGSGPVAQTLYLIHYGDYVSYEVGMLRGVDPTDVSLIQKLKSEISK